MAKLFGNKTQLTVKELKPTDANQKNSKEYVAKLHEILSFKEKYNKQWMLLSSWKLMKIQTAN